MATTEVFPTYSVHFTTHASRVRRLARRHGYFIKKSRAALGLHNQGEFMVLDLSMNVPVLGWDFDATLDDIETWFRGNDEALEETGAQR